MWPVGISTGFQRPMTVLLHGPTAGKTELKFKMVPMWILQNACHWGCAMRMWNSLHLRRNVQELFWDICRLSVYLRLHYVLWFWKYIPNNWQVEALNAKLCYSSLQAYASVIHYCKIAIVDVWMQDCGISNANALEVLQSCTKLSIYPGKIGHLSVISLKKLSAQQNWIVSPVIEICY